MLRDISQVFKIWKKGLKIIFRGRKITFMLFGHRNRGREKKNPNFSLRSMKFCLLEFIGPRMKVYLLNEGYAWVPKMRDFVEGFYYTPRGRDSSYFGLFSTLWAVWLCFLP